MTSAQFEALLNNYGNSIFGFCYRLTGNTNMAEDLYQDSVFKAFGMLEKIDCQNSDGFKTAKNYIIGIAVRLYKNQMRKKSFRDSSLSADDEVLIQMLRTDSDIVTETEQKELRSAVKQLVELLPDKLRIVTYMFYYAEMSLNEIAQQLHIPIGTAKSWLNRARANIKKELEDKHYE